MNRRREPSAPELSDPPALKPVEFYVLVVLADGDLYGYGIVKEIEERTEGRLSLEPGNLYRYIRRLHERGLVEPVDRRPQEDEGDERRRYYTVTARGRHALALDAARMRSLAAAAEARVEVPPS